MEQGNGAAQWNRPMVHPNGLPDEFIKSQLSGIRYRRRAASTYLFEKKFRCSPRMVPFGLRVALATN